MNELRFFEYSKRSNKIWVWDPAQHRGYYVSRVTKKRMHSSNFSLDEVIRKHWQELHMDTWMDEGL